jgi:hypothetical protein
MNCLKLGIAISIHHVLANFTCHFRVQIPWLDPLPRHFPFTKNKHSSLNYLQTTNYRLPTRKSIQNKAIDQIQRQDDFQVSHHIYEPLRFCLRR